MLAAKLGWTLEPMSTLTSYLGRACFERSLKNARFVLIALALCIVALSSSFRATTLHSAQAPTGLIMGRVVDGATQEAVGGARVSISGSGKPDVQVADSEGRFVFFNLPAGSYRFVAEQEGYAYGAFGRTTPTSNVPVLQTDNLEVISQTVILAPGQRRGDVLIRLWKYGAISGRVVDERSDPVVGTHVQAWPRLHAGGRRVFSSVFPRVGWTDDRGIFRIPNVTEGDYIVGVPTVTVTTPAALGLDKNVATWSMPLFRLANLYHPTTSFESLFPSEGRNNALSAGNWLASTIAVPVVHAGAPPGTSVYPTTFVPGVQLPGDALVIHVESGRVSSAPDLQLRPVASHSVSGRLVAAGGPKSNVTVLLMPAGDGVDSTTGIAITDTQGAFAFVGVADGAYRLNVTAWPQEGGPSVLLPRDVPDATVLLRFGASPLSSASTWWSSQLIDVRGSDIRDIEVSLREGARLSGVVRFESAIGRPPPSESELKNIHLELDRPNGLPLAVQAAREIDVSASGGFRSLGLPSGQYYIRAPHAFAGWYLQSVMAGGRDISLRPIELGLNSIDSLVATFTDRPSEVSAEVRTESGAIAESSTVVIFPTERIEWSDFGFFPRRLAAGRVDTNGHTVFRGLPPGEYFIAALSDSRLAEWPTLEFFQAFATTAERIRLMEHETRTLQLRIEQRR